MVNPLNILGFDLRQRAVRAAAMILVGLSLAGCNAESGLFRTAGGPEAAITVSVRDRETKLPVTGAMVAAETMSRDHAFSVASITYQTLASSSSGTTDAAGAVQLKVLADRHYRLRVWPRGRSPVVFFHGEPSPLPADEWLSPSMPPGGMDPGVEVRIEPAGK